MHWWRSKEWTQPRKSSFAPVSHETFTKSLAQSCVWSCLNWRTHLRIHEIHETGFVRPISLVGLIDLLQKTVANKNPNLHSDLADSTPNSPLLLHKATLTRGWWRLTIPCEVALGQEAATCQAIGSASLEQRLKHHKTWTSTQSIHIESYSHIKFPANIDAIVNIRWPLPASPLAKKCQGRIAGSHNIGLHSCHRAHKDWKTSRILRSQHSKCQCVYEAPGRTFAFNTKY